MRFSSQDRDRFALRFYEWSVGRLLDEFALKFERVVNARVKTGAYVEAMARTAAPDRKATVMSCLKRLQPRGAEFAGEPLSAKEQTLLHKFDNLRTEVQAEWNLRGFVEGTLLQPRPRGEIRRHLVKQLKHELPDALGEPDEGKRVWSYRRDVNGHIVRTRCDTSGTERHYDIEYGHTIPEQSGSKPLVFNESWMSWLGISGHTQWLLSDEADIPLVVAVVKTAAREFFEVLPDVLPEAPRAQGE